jgi:hypothetical protein
MDQLTRLAAGRPHQPLANAEAQRPAERPPR